MSKKQPDSVADDVEYLISKVTNSTKSIYVGIDPGVSGAIAVLCGDRYVVVDIPTVEVSRTRTVKKKPAEMAQGGPKTRTLHGKATKFDYDGIIALFKLLSPVKKRVHVCWEIAKPQGKIGKGGNNLRTAHITGIGYGMWQLFLRCRGYASCEEFEPADWKKTFQLTNKDKEASRLKARGLFPKAPLARKGDHNRAEALLIAECLKRRRGQEKFTI